MRPVKNKTFTFYMSLTSQADPKLHQNNPTLDAGDVKVSTDGGAESDLDTLPVVTPAGSDRIKVVVSADEMNGDNVSITFSDAAGDQWCDITVNIQTILFDPDELGTVSQLNDASATTTSFVTDLTEATDDHYNDSALVFLDGVCAGQVRKISDYNGTTKAITLSAALTDAPGDNDRFMILGRLSGD